jgi:hypothetical protein
MFPCPKFSLTSPSAPEAVAVPAIIDQITPWYYRVAPLIAMSLLDDPAMLALAFC